MSEVELNIQGVRKVFRHNKRHGSSYEDETFMCRKLASRSTDLVIITGCLSLRRIRIFAHNFTNNESIVRTFSKI